MHDDIPLTYGETIRWKGVPDPSMHFTRFDRLMIPFSLVWTTGVFWVLATFSDASPWIAPVIMSFLATIGIYFVVGRFLVKYLAKRRTTYVLTNERVLILRPTGTSWMYLEDARGPIVDIGRRHMQVWFDARPGPLSSTFAVLDWVSAANTGLDVIAMMGPSRPIAFFDVADIDGLSEALLTMRGAAEPEEAL